MKINVKEILHFNYYSYSLKNRKKKVLKNNISQNKSIILNG